MRGEHSWKERKPCREEVMLARFVMQPQHLAAVTANSEGRAVRATRGRHSEVTLGTKPEVASALAALEVTRLLH